MVTIDEFLGLFPKATTRRTYRTALNQFHDIAGVPSTDYFNNGRTYEYDVIAYYNNLKARNLAPKSIMTKVKGAVRSYLIENEVELPKRFWKRLKISSYPITKDRLFTKEELRMIVSHLDIAARSVVFSELSNGLRIDDTLQNILLDNLHLEMNPARFYYYNSKIERDCVAFLTTEAKTIIEEWLKVRKDWCMEHLWIRNVYFGWTDLGFEEWCEEKRRNERLFPFEKDVFYNRWWYALDCSGLNQRDKRTKRRVLHSQTFRKYFKSWVGTSLPQDVVECLIGHTEGLNNINTIYNLYGQDCEDALAKDFLKIEPLLSLNVFVTNQEKIDNLEKVVEKLMTMVEGKQKADLNQWLADQETYEEAKQKEYEWHQSILIENPQKLRTKT